MSHISRDKIKTIYFTVVPIGHPNNGGAIVCQSHIESLCSDKSINLIVVTANTETVAQENQFYLNSLDIQNHHIIYGTSNSSIQDNTDLPSVKYPFILEKESLQHKNVDIEFLKIIQVERPDIIVVDYLMSAQFIPSTLESHIPRCMITLNREADFCANHHILQLGIDPDSTEFKTSYEHWKKLEQSLYDKFNGIIALTDNDIPNHNRKTQYTTTIPVLLGKSQNKWRFLSNKRIFFVGSISHYPNLEAIEWICTKLIPQVFDINPSIEFRIIGANSDELPENWQHESLQLLGSANDAQVEFEFTHNDLFIAPISNNYGSKIKLLKCISHGMPFLATKEALSGISFIKNAPHLDLNNATGSAQTLCNLIEDQEQLTQLSISANAQSEKIYSQLKNVWSETLKMIIQHAHKL